MAEGDEAPLPCQGRGLDRTSLDSEHPTVSALDDLDQLELEWLCEEFDRQERDAEEAIPRQHPSPTTSSQQQSRGSSNSSPAPPLSSTTVEDRRPWTVPHALAVIRQGVLHRGGTHRGSLRRLYAKTGWSRQFTNQTLELWQRDGAVTFSIDGDALTITILQRPATSSAPSSRGPAQGPAQPADSDAADYDPSAASEALDGPIDRNHLREIFLAIQRTELRAFFRISLGRHARTIDLDDAIEKAGVDLDLVYGRRELGKLIGMTPEHYARFADDALGRKEAKFPTRIIPGCFSKADAKRFRDDKNRPGRTAARQRSRARARAATAALEKQPVLDARDKSILRAFNHWMTVRQAAERLLRNAAWKGPNGKRLDANSIIRVINRKLRELEPWLERGPARRDHRGWDARLMRRRR